MIKVNVNCHTRNLLDCLNDLRSMDRVSAVSLKSFPSADVIAAELQRDVSTGECKEFRSHTLPRDSA